MQYMQALCRFGMHFRRWLCAEWPVRIILSVHSFHSLWDSDTVDSDRSSMESWSTSTTDNNPGTGRIIDLYIYQKFGKKLERKIGQLTVPFRRSEVIRRLIMDMSCGDSSYMLDDLNRYPMPSIKQNISGLPNGNDILRGVDELARRAKSVACQFSPYLSLLYKAYHNC